MLILARKAIELEISNLSDIEFGKWCGSDMEGLKGNRQEAAELLKSSDFLTVNGENLISGELKIGKQRRLDK